MKCLHRKPFSFELSSTELIRLVLRITVLLALSAVWAEPARSLPPQETLRAEGTVRDTGGHPVSGATVYLLATGAKEPLKTLTDAGGTFSLISPHPGAFTVWAEKAGTGKSATAFLTLSAEQPRRIDLVLLAPDSTGRSATGQASATARSDFEFKDEPNFTVAGLTDWTNAGGHGSDVHLRASETLTKETLTLKPQPAGEKTLPGGPVREKELHDNLARAPQSFAANHELGEFYLRSQKPADAVTYLRRAYKIDPADYSNAYDLGLALNAAGESSQARAHVQEMLKRQDKAELHRLLGEIDERMNDPLGAVSEYEQAVRLEPSEPNYFAWGTELLYHRAVEPAIQVFTQASSVHPRSARLLMGLAVALYAHGSSEQAARRLVEASDLDPASTGPYLFMGRMEGAVREPIPGVEQYLSRFLRLHPENALAHYYYAVSLWKRERLSHSDTVTARVESLLHRALQIDPGLAPAQLQLGILYADQQRLPEAVQSFQKAIAIAPGLEEAHYRLGQTYTRLGKEAEAKQQFQLYDRISRQKAAEIQKERREIRQFVITLRAQPPSSNP